MIRRINKTTSLLLAAASVVSVMPSVKAEAAVYLKNENATIESAAAFNGTFIFEGYKEDEEDSLYFKNASGKEIVIDSYNTGIEKKLGNQYLITEAGLVDMESGKIVQDTDESDFLYYASSTVKSALRKAGRWNSDTASDALKIKAVNEGTASEGSRFEDSFYLVTSDKDSEGNDTEIQRFGFADTDGKFIDCSYDLNMQVYADLEGDSGAAGKGKMYTVENADSEVKITGSKDGEEIKLASLKYVKYLTQDDDYIYSVIRAGFENTRDYAGEKMESTVYRYYVQKASKKAGSKQDGVYKPSTTECYEIGSSENGSKLNTTAVQNAFDYLAYDIENAETEGASNPFATGSEVIYTAVNGDILVTEVKANEIKVSKIDLTTEKVSKPYRPAQKMSVKAAVLTSGNKDINHKIETEEGYSIDVDGLPWILYRGKIYVFDAANMDWDNEYAVDRDMESLEVYDKNNLITWYSDADDYEDNIYAYVSGGKTEDEGEDVEDPVNPDDKPDTDENPDDGTTTPPAEEVITPGWKQNADGTWVLYGDSQNKLTGWHLVDGKWYFMNHETGVMQTGWLYEGGNWYYLNPTYTNGYGPTGSMRTGWLKDTDGNWYYLNKDGSMRTGWFTDSDGRKYYLRENQSPRGAMVAGTVVDGIKLGANGAAIG